MIKMKKLDLDGRQKEKIIYRNELLHYGLYMPSEDGYFYGDIPWHWHDEFEFGTLLGGSMLYKTNRGEYILKEGDGIFINSGVLHYLHPLEPLQKVKLQTQFFDKSFLAGASGSLFDMKYMTPVQEQKELDAVPLYQEKPRDRQVLEWLKEGSKLSLEGERFFEFRLRSVFSRVWEQVYGWAEERKKGAASYNALEDERIKQMLSFMQENYQEKLTVETVAACIPISERECYRLFQKSLGVSPAAFLLSFRLQKAQEMLMNTRKSILEIALETGFGTSSYFGKMFRQYHHMTPRQYRGICREK